MGPLTSALALATAFQPTAPAANDQDDLIIDLFAGGGGASEGIVEATGRHPDLAVNHNQETVNLHRANHPTTLHLCEDIRRVDPVAVLTKHWPRRRVGLLWASPDCRHHSKASGAALKDRGVRGLAWEVVRWTVAIKKATGHFPALVALENVEEFAEWGPLHRYGKKAGKVQKKRRSETFNLWKATFERLGATVEKKELVAADYGTPTTRKRLFVVISFTGPVAWPEPTHGKVAQIGDLFAAPRKPWKSAGEHVIDWSLRCPSIFARRKPLAPKTHKRIAKGIKRFVIEAARPFIVPVTHAGERKVYGDDEPLPRTITSSGGFAASTAFLTPRYGENAGQEPRALSVEAPYPTVVPHGNGGDVTEVRLSGASVGVGGRAGQSPPRGLDEPVNTVTAKSDRAIATAYLGRQFGTTTGQELDAPHPTVMTDGAGGKSQLVTAHLGRMAKGSVGSDLADPTLTSTAKAKDQLVAPILDKYYETGVAQAADRPVDTITAKGRFGLNAAFLEQANTGVVGHSADEPVSTLLAAGSHQRVVEAELEAIGAPVGSKRRAVLEFLWEHFGEPTASEWADPLATPTGRLRFGLVVLDGIFWQIIDIGMRMLTPRELYNAQGFPPSYIIDVTWEGKPLTKTAQTRMAGNSVCPKVAAALLRANLPDKMLRRLAA